jgi:hypothetical protein
MHYVTNITKFCSLEGASLLQKRPLRSDVTMRIFAFSLNIEGTTEKVLQFIMPLESIYNGNFGFNEQKEK